MIRPKYSSSCCLCATHLLHLVVVVVVLFRAGVSFSSNEIYCSAIFCEILTTYARCFVFGIAPFGCTKWKWKCWKHFSIKIRDEEWEIIFQTGGRSDKRVILLKWDERREKFGFTFWDQRASGLLLLWIYSGLMGKSNSRRFDLSKLFGQFKCEQIICRSVDMLCFYNPVRDAWLQKSVWIIQ